MKLISRRRFQSTLPRRERQHSLGTAFALSYFNPRSREGSDFIRLSNFSLLHLYFNPRSREGSDTTVSVPFDSSHNFNPRSREGSDGLFSKYCFHHIISIHAPAKGATWQVQRLKRVRKFQSTLPRRERPSCKTKLYFLSPNFNPRSREGSDDYQLLCLRIVCISIHAPAKGATLLRRCFLFGFKDFNPRSREGSDITKPPILIPHYNFNPRSREGSDSNIIQQISFSLYNTVYFVSNNIK